MENNPEIAKENIRRYLCEQCGANMVFDPKAGKLACPYCGSTRAIQTSGAEIVERDFYEFLRPEAGRLQPLATGAMQVSCGSCGATVIFVPPETATECDFCGGKIVAQPKAADPLVAPESVLPFSFTSNQATSALKNWTSSRWFAPNKLKTLAEHDKAQSVYLPYWTFDADSFSRYTGERGEDYQETETYYENGEQKERSVTRTNWYRASGNVERHFDDVSTPATKSVLPKYLERLSWDFENLVSYEPAYLSGHKAQTYQVSLEEGFERFKQIAAGVIYEDVRRDIGGDRQQIHAVDTDYSNITFKHLLVPVYAGAYRFNSKVYQVVINGRTGEVQGERPYSWLKIGCLIVAIISVILFILLIVGIARSI